MWKFYIVTVTHDVLRRRTCPVHHAPVKRDCDLVF
jgi:hypothetical protein